MSDRHFRNLLEAQWALGKFVCVGLDSAAERIPSAAFARRQCAGPHVGSTILNFNKAIIDQTCDIAGFYKLNFSFYEEHGPEGLWALQATVQYANMVAPTVPIIGDGKRNDIGTSTLRYVRAAFDYFGIDAATVNPYLGREALQPFLDRSDKGIFVLCRTSNPGAGEFQDLLVEGPEGKMPFYLYVAQSIAKHWNTNGNCGLVVGATYPAELAQVRDIVGDLPFLIPGIGTQGGNLEKTVRYGRDSRGQGMLINSSSGIIFASSGEDFAGAARCETLALHESITKQLQ